MNEQYFNPRNASIAVMSFAATGLFVFKTTDCNIMDAVTPIVLTLVGFILSHALLQKLFSLPVFCLTTERQQPSVEPVVASVAPTPVVAAPISEEPKPVAARPASEEPKPMAAPVAQPISTLDRYEALQAEALRKEQKRRQDTLVAVNEYVTIATAGFLSKKSLATLLDNIGRMATGCAEPYQPLSSDMDKKLKLPDLRHLAWNIGERLGVSRRERARFIQASFPYELKNATLEYLELNLRDLVPAAIKIDIPDKGDFRFHYEAENAA